jgi:ubiquinone/menaquinone biosynthesis C-methylase UbiE
MINVFNYLESLGLAPDYHVADFGSGTGAIARQIAELVPNGKVFAIDVDSDKVEHLNTDIKREKLTNIISVWGDIETLGGSRLRAESIDVGLISQTFFLLKNKHAATLEIKRILKRGGRFVVIDWHTHLGNSVGHKDLLINEKELRLAFEQSGFKTKSIDNTKNHFVFVVEKL